MDTSQQSLYQLDLRNVTNGAIQIISKSSNRRKRSITMDITPALTLDPISGLLWVCDQSTGNILSCNASSMQCNVEVTMAPSVGELGMYVYTYDVAAIYRCTCTYTCSAVPVLLSIVIVQCFFSIYYRACVSACVRASYVRIVHAYVRA